LRAVIHGATMAASIRKCKAVMFDPILDLSQMIAG
jgi:hypothetical protein